MLLAQFQGICKNKTQFQVCRWHSKGGKVGVFTISIPSPHHIVVVFVQELVQKCRQLFGEKKKLSFVM